MNGSSSMSCSKRSLGTRPSMRTGSWPERSQVASSTQRKRSTPRSFQLHLRLVAMDWRARSGSGREALTAKLLIAFIATPLFGGMPAARPISLRSRHRPFYTVLRPCHPDRSSPVRRCPPSTIGTNGHRMRTDRTKRRETMKSYLSRGHVTIKRVAALLDPGLRDIMRARHSRRGSSTYKPALELRVERERARSGAWYEFFPRSTGRTGKHGTFVTSARLLPKIAAMGFDVVYLPPIHPIGVTNRKGKNNSLEATPTDVGVPWAIGAAEGGHDAVHPKLGTIKDFDDFVAAADKLGIEVALDFVISCSPDHPWVKEHPEWFHHRPDGTIKYAENPPKKYQDVYPVNFDTDNARALWESLKEIVDFWISHGVKIFRVDNPHTKPFQFWEWLIASVQEEHPEVIFLAEAFTRPKVMRNLAKLGFSQSYTL